jgi:hypothetical protein
MINAFSLNKLLNKMISCQHLSRFFRFIPFDLLAPKEFRFIWYSNFLTLSVPDESYSSNVSCALPTFETIHIQKLVYDISPSNQVI